MTVTFNLPSFMPIINKMFSKEVLELLKQVILSWQVLVVTIALVLYIFVVNYVARRYHAPRKMKKISFNFKKAKPAANAAGTEDEITTSHDDDDLGLEED